jgi:hypothetical protein
LIFCVCVGGFGALRMGFRRRGASAFAVSSCMLAHRICRVATGAKLVGRKQRDLEYCMDREATCKACVVYGTCVLAQIDRFVHLSHMRQPSY